MTWGASITSAILALATLATLAAPGARGEERPQNPPLIDDLIMLASVLPTYKVVNASPAEALTEVFRVALGREPTHIQIPGIFPLRKEVVSKISLDLKNVPVAEVLRYIQELSGCYKYELSGTHPETLRLALEGDHGSLHSEFSLLYSQGFKLSPSVIKKLGLRDVMTTTELMEQLKKCGISLSQERGHAAYWSPQTQTLAVRSGEGGIDLTASVIHLLDTGFQVVRDAPR